MHRPANNPCWYSASPNGYFWEVVMWWVIAIAVLILAYRIRQARLDDIYQEDQDRWGM